MASTTVPSTTIFSSVFVIRATPLPLHPPPRPLVGLQRRPHPLHLRPAVPARPALRWAHQSRQAPPPGWARSPPARPGQCAVDPAPHLEFSPAPWPPPPSPPRPTP